MFLWCWLLLLLFFIHCFLASSLTLARVITRFLHTFCTFSLDHHRVIRDAFILTFLGPFATVLSRVLRFWEDVFYPQAFFALRSFPTFLAQPTFQGLPGIGQFFLEVCRASCWSTKHKPGPSVCLIRNNPQKENKGRFQIWFTTAWLPEVSASCPIVTLFAIVHHFLIIMLYPISHRAIQLHFSSIMLYPFDHRAIQLHISSIMFYPFAHRAIQFVID